MTKPHLYLLVGYPGAGKTTVAKIIAEVTKAKHLWADVERHKLYPDPTHSKQESDNLYAKLNEVTDYLLKRGKSVVFDTSFNHYSDRQKLRQIANQHQAETSVIWVNTALEVAKNRAVKSHQSRNLYEMRMSEAQFNSITHKLEPPRINENVIKVDGTNLNKETLISLLKTSN